MPRHATRPPRVAPPPDAGQILRVLDGIACRGHHRARVFEDWLALADSLRQSEFWPLQAFLIASSADLKML